MRCAPGVCPSPEPARRHEALSAPAGRASAVPGGLPTVDWYDPMVTVAGAAGLTGLEAMRGWKFGCAVEESVYNPIGVVHGGLVCTLLDVFPLPTAGS